MNETPWGSTKIIYRRVFLILWRSDVDTDRLGKSFIKLPFRFWLQYRRLSKTIDFLNVLHVRRRTEKGEEHGIIKPSNLE